MAGYKYVTTNLPDTLILMYPPLFYGATWRVFFINYTLQLFNTLALVI